LLTIAGLNVAAAGPLPAPASALGSISVVRHLGGSVTAVTPTTNYVLWAKGAELEVYSADGASRVGGLLLPELIADIDVDWPQVYVAARDGLYLVDLANPSAPALTQSISAPPLVDLAMVSTVVGVGTYAYVGLADGGLWTVDLAAPAGAATASILAPSHHFVSELYHFGDYLFSVDNASGTPGQPRVWSLADPAAPADLGVINTRSDASGLAIVGGRLFLSTFYEGLALYAWDPAQPLAATLLGSLPVAAGAYDLTVTSDGTRAFLAAEGSLLYVDVANPAQPVLLDSVSAPLGY
jgi:hypothetical protein